MMESIYRYLKRSLEDFKKRQVFVALFWIAVIAAPIFVLERLFSVNVQDETKTLKEHFEQAYLTNHPVKNILLNVFWDPLWEELVFRGPIRFLGIIIDKYCRRETLRLLIISPVIIFQAVVWASYHVSPVSMAIIGAILGFVVYKTKSLPTVIAAHMIINASFIIALFINCCVFH